MLVAIVAIKHSIDFQYITVRVGPREFIASTIKAQYDPLAPAKNSKRRSASNTG